MSSIKVSMEEGIDLLFPDRASRPSASKIERNLNGNTSSVIRPEASSISKVKSIQNTNLITKPRENLPTKLISNPKSLGVSKSLVEPKKIFTPEEERLLSKTMKYDHLKDAYNNIDQNKEFLLQMMKKENEARRKEIEKKQRESLNNKLNNSKHDLVGSSKNTNSQGVSRDRAADQLIIKQQAKKIDELNKKIDESTYLNKKRHNNMSIDDLKEKVKKDILNNPQKPGSNKSLADIKAKLTDALKKKNAHDQNSKANIIKIVRSDNLSTLKNEMNLHKAEVRQSTIKDNLMNKNSKNTGPSLSETQRSGPSKSELDIQAKSNLHDKIRGNIKRPELRKEQQNGTLNSKDNIKKQILNERKEIKLKESIKEKVGTQSQQQSTFKNRSAESNLKTNNVNQHGQTLNDIKSKIAASMMLGKREKFEKRSAPQQMKPVVANSAAKPQILKAKTQSYQKISQYNLIDDEDEYEEGSFIVSDEEDEQDPLVTQTINELKLRKMKYQNYDDDDIEEVGYDQIDQEEAYSARIGATEDYQEFIKEQEYKKKVHKK